MTYDPDMVFPPGETLREMMDDRNMTANQLAYQTGITRISILDICAGVAPITQDIANRLEKYFNVPKEFWLALESNYQQWVKEQPTPQDAS